MRVSRVEAWSVPSRDSLISNACSNSAPPSFERPVLKLWKRRGPMIQAQGIYHRTCSPGRRHYSPTSGHQVVAGGCLPGLSPRERLDEVQGLLRSALGFIIQALGIADRGHLGAKFRGHMKRFYAFSPYISRSCGLMTRSMSPKPFHPKLILIRLT